MKDPIAKAELAKLIKQLNEGLASKKIEFPCHTSDVVVMISSMQLALFESNVSRGMKKMIRKTCEKLIESIGITPLIRRVLWQGFTDSEKILELCELSPEAN